MISVSLSEFRLFHLIEHYAQSGSNEDRHNLVQLAKAYFSSPNITSTQLIELRELIETKAPYNPDKISAIAVQEIAKLNKKTP